MVYAEPRPGTGKNRCHYCEERAGATADHIIPKSRAGTNERWNLVRSCYACNQAKGNRLPTCRCQKCKMAISKHWTYIQRLPAAERWPVLRLSVGLYFDRQPEIQQAWCDYVEAGSPARKVRRKSRAKRAFNRADRMPLSAPTGLAVQR